MQNRILATAALFTLAISNLCSGALVVEFEDHAFFPGTIASIDVYIRSDGTSVDNLSSYSAAFEIEQISGTGILEFLPSNFPLPAGEHQSDSERTVAKPNAYVFLNALDTSSAAFLSLRDRGSSQELNQRDKALSDMTIGTDRLLLARLEVKHITTDVDADAKYRIKLNQSIPTVFRDSANSLAAFNVGDSNANFGTISFTTTAVPEPSSILLLSVAAGLVCVRRKKCRPMSSI
ncbi:hypothetical protein K227x_13430 [Rubripirellula lacrimiformis]|uniref:Ice-binding protein C-terminal domain-containing protein n=1 Tax=Rubripirellula lacrimiformis TaxID=1930273 RepID=A0A517N740_9BACT|nr:PEP-CTERM sorting domain-containing protein [Rubripirellula lacrimiformis]QDT02964.1 hypothetical protein K227x_13430 [Rubripirellula lacrimiformis]